MTRTGSDDTDVPRHREEASFVSPLPDPRRISSVETVRAYLSETHAEAAELAAWRAAQELDPSIGHRATEVDAAGPGGQPLSLAAAAPVPSAAPSPAGPAEAPGSHPPIDYDDAIPRPARVPTDRASTSIWEGAPVDLSSHASPQDAPIDRRYEMLERVASGGMAEIYRVRHRSLGKVFALKRIHYAHPGSAARMRQLFYREARLVSRLDHPNIVSVTDFGVDPDLGAYIVMEYLKGETLYDRLRRVKRLRVHTALEIGLQVAEALHYMHGQSVIHCDVKAENVFLLRTETAGVLRPRLHVKLIDFGLSRPRTANVVLARDEVGGTPQYMPPELIRGQAPQPSMDIYALGVLLYEMITGVVPLEGPTPQDTIQAQLEQEPLPPSAVLEEPLESRVEALILQALQKNPADRQPSMGHVIFQLRTVMQMYGLRGARQAPSTTAERPAVARAKVLRQIVTSCPLPLFQMNPEGRLTFVNKAFCRFLREREEDLLGRRVGDTRLALVYPSVQSDAETCARSKDRVPLRRAFAFRLEDGTRNELLCWLRPEMGTGGRVVAVNGYIHQLG